MEERGNGQGSPSHSSPLHLLSLGYMPGFSATCWVEGSEFRDLDCDAEDRSGERGGTRHLAQPVQLKGQIISGPCEIRYRPCVVGVHGSWVIVHGSWLMGDS